MAKHADPAHGTLSEAEKVKSSTGSSGPAEPDPQDSSSDVTPSPTTELRADDTEDYDDAVAGGVADSSEDDAPVRKPRSPVRLAAVLGLVIATALGGLVGWTGFRQHQAQQVQHKRELLIQVARQGALNLTTIDWQHADADIQRILDSATGTFYDDFSNRSKPFVEVIKKAQSKSVGTVTEAGLESQSGDEAQVLVALSVKSSTADAAEQEPRNWRMRISVQKLGNEVKVSNVAFVP